MWVGRPVRCRVASRAALPGAKREDRPAREETDGPRARGAMCLFVEAIAPRQDAGEPRARRATHRVGWTSRPMQGGVPRRPVRVRNAKIVPREKRRTDGSARGAIRVALTSSLPGRMPGSLARDARPTFAQSTGRDPHVGWTSRPMQGGVPRRPAWCEMRRSSRERRDERTAAREERCACLLRPSLPGRMPGSLARDARPTFAQSTGRGPQSGLDVPSDAGWRPAPPCPVRDAKIVPREKRRTDRSARGAFRVWLRPSLPGRMPGSLARDARPTFAQSTGRGPQSGLDVPSDAGWRPAPPCPVRDAKIVPREKRRTDRSARGAFRVWLRPSLPGRMPGSLARDARPTFAQSTGRDPQSGLDVPSDAGWRPAPPCPVRGTKIVPREKRRTDGSARGAMCVFVEAIAPRQDDGEPRARRATHRRATHFRAIHRARPTCGLDVPSDAGWRPAPPCPVRNAKIVPREKRRTDRSARGAMCVFVEAIAPRQDAGEPRARRATHRRATHRRATARKAPYCAGTYVGS